MSFNLLRIRIFPPFLAFSFLFGFTFTLPFHNLILSRNLLFPFLDRCRWSSMRFMDFIQVVKGMLGIPPNFSIFWYIIPIQQPCLHFRVKSNIGEDPLVIAEESRFGNKDP